MGNKIIYQSGEGFCDMRDLEVCLGEGVYGISVESAIEFKRIEDVKNHYLKLLGDCKEYLEQKYKLNFKGECSEVRCKLFYNERFELFSIGFDVGEFLRLEDLYLWVCGIIDQVSCI